eukprot:Ihof_evm1s51 gene=Ihof_evmTU1s51
MKVTLKQEASLVLRKTFRWTCVVLCILFILRWGLGQYKDASVESYIWDGQPNPTKKNVILINAAGGLGMHLTMQLHEQGDRVVAIDTLAHHNDQERDLKSKRAEQLDMKYGIFIRGNGCEMNFLMRTMKRFFKNDSVLRDHSPSTVLLYEASSSRLVVNRTGNVTVGTMAMSAAYGRSLNAAAALYHNLYSIQAIGVMVNEMYGPWVGPGTISYQLVHQALIGNIINVKTDNPIGLIHINTAVELFVKLINSQHLHHSTYSLDLTKVPTFTIDNLANSIGQEIGVHINLNGTNCKGFTCKYKKTANEDVPWAQSPCPVPVTSLDGHKKLNTGDFIPWIRAFLMDYDSNEVRLESLTNSMLPANVTNPMTKAAIKSWYRRGGGAGRSVVFACYFSRKKDPQRGSMLGSDNFDYIEKWYESVKKLELEAVIFHDGLSPDFIASYSTSTITFMRVNLGERSTNDERFFFYRDYLADHLEITAVVMTDISDVVFRMNPFELMMVMGDYVYAGRDYGNTMGGNGWLIP